MERFRVISLDGGGVRGLVTAALLEQLMARVPDLLSRADLLAGTSSGGILALALASGRSPAHMRGLYLERSRQIFQRRAGEQTPDLVRHAGAFYDNRVLRRELKRELGAQTRLGDLSVPVMIPCFELDTRQPDPQMRSWQPRLIHTLDRDAPDAERLAWQVALYTSAAPGFFPSVDGFVDGGVFAPNPTLLASAELLRRHRAGVGPPLPALRVLSLGTGITPRFVSGRRRDWPLSEWVENGLLEMMLDGMTESTHRQAEALLGEAYQRVNAPLPPGEPFSLDAAPRLGDLLECARQADLCATLDWLERHWS